MIDHIHMIAKGENLKGEINKLKSYIARKVIDWAKSRNQTNLLQQLKIDDIDDRDFKLWEAGFKPVQITNSEIMKSWLNYIHNNPVKKGFVINPEDWLRSSALNYAGDGGLLDIVVDW